MCVIMMWLYRAEDKTFNWALSMEYVLHVTLLAKLLEIGTKLKWACSVSRQSELKRDRASLGSGLLLMSATKKKKVYINKWVN